LKIENKIIFSTLSFRLIQFFGRIYYKITGQRGTYM